MARFFAVCLGFLLTCAAAQAQSFNCRYAKLPAEVAICNEGELAALDEEMARLYYSVVNSAPPRAARTIKAEQRSFIRRRNACGYDGQCILGSYRRRIQHLYEWADALGL